MSFLSSNRTILYNNKSFVSECHRPLCSRVVLVQADVEARRELLQNERDIEYVRAEKLHHVKNHAGETGRETCSAIMRRRDGNRLGSDVCTLARSPAAVQKSAGFTSDLLRSQRIGGAAISA